MKVNENHDLKSKPVKYIEIQDVFNAKALHNNIDKYVLC